MKENFSVSIRNCTSYDYNKVEQEVFALLEEQEIEKKIQKGTKVFVKANLLMKKSPEEFVTTHPSVVEAICRFVSKHGGEVTVGDSPGGPNTTALMKDIYRGCGYEYLEREGIAKLNYDFSWEDVAIGQGNNRKNIRILKTVRQSHVVINACKCKTHGMMTFTGAAKNLFGVVPGTHKAAEHFRYVDPYAFGHRLIDLCQEVSADISIMDAIGIMEGNGPSSGKSRHLGYLLCGNNPYEVDAVACEIGGVDPKRVPMLLGARRRNLYDPQTVKWDKRLIEGKDIKPFLLPQSVSVNFSAVPLPRFISRRLEKYLKAKPVFRHDKCIGCHRCEESCPAKAITLSKEKTPHLDEFQCIHCFCCHELCPAKAIDIKESPLRWLRKKGS